MFLEPRLFAGKLYQTALCRLGAALLKACAAFREFRAGALYVSSAVNLSVARRGNRDNAKIDADPIVRPELFCFWNVASASEKPFAAHEAKIDLALTKGEQVALMLPGDEFELHTAFDGPYRNRIVTAKTKDAIVIRLGSIGAEDRGGGAIDLEGISNLRDAANGGLRRQIEVGAHIGIGELMQIELPEDASCKPLSRNRGASLIAAFERRFENGGLLPRGQKLDCGDQLHTSNIEDFAVIAREPGFSRRTR